MFCNIRTMGYMCITSAGTIIIIIIISSSSIIDNLYSGTSLLQTSELQKPL